MKKFLSVIIIIFLCFTPSYAMPLFENRGKVLVLTYHLISDNPQDWGNYCIPPSAFESDIATLKNNGYEFLKASEIADADISKRKIAVITFDDGYKSDIEFALPVLKKYNACATFFIYGEAIGKDNYLTKDDVKTLSQETCAEIGNHSYSVHSDSKDTLITMYSNIKYQNTVINDFLINNNLLKEITGKSPTALSYPNGVYSSEINSVLMNYGIKITFSTDEIQFKKPSVLKAVGRKNRSYNRNMTNLLK